MSWFLNLSIRPKLMVSFGLLILFLAVAIITAYQSIKTIQESEKKLLEVDFSNAMEFNLLEINIHRARADVLSMMILAKGPAQNALHNDLIADTKESEERLKKLSERNKNDLEVLGKLKELKVLREKFKKIRDEETIPSILSGELEKARAVQPSQNEIYHQIQALARELAINSERNAQTAVAQSSEKANQAVVVFISVSLVALLLSIILVIFLNRIIATPLKEIATAAKRIAEGNLSGEKLPVASQDEIGQLADVFNHMLVSLRELTGQTLAITQNLNAAAVQIMASTQEQAASTREQAATVQEITTTMDEVNQSGTQIKNKAKQVATAAEATSASSNSGVQVVQDTTRTMTAIREQVEEVAENIVALSEKTQAVGEIIATVNDIAERSNLLALNAAIEAAGTGEQGNRFSVVANEMKNLADQAKDSTIQVRTILGDIQKGINSSVMLTEEAVKRVELGKQQADLTEQTIRQMTKTTLESIQAFEQIIGAGNQQQIGFEQVAQGMKDIRQAASQTAAATAQLEKAVANLNSLGQELKESVGRYRL